MIKLSISYITVYVLWFSHPFVIISNDLKVLYDWRSLLLQKKNVFYFCFGIRDQSFMYWQSLLLWRHSSLLTTNGNFFKNKNYTEPIAYIYRKYSIELVKSLTLNGIIFLFTIVYIFKTNCFFFCSKFLRSSSCIVTLWFCIKKFISHSYFPISKSESLRTIALISYIYQNNVFNWAQLLINDCCSTAFSLCLYNGHRHFLEILLLEFCSWQYASTIEMNSFADDVGHEIS